MVRNADLTNPAADELSWFGFLDDTDGEIRIETNTGSGYDGLHWFANFQNYTTEAAGNPYDHFFVNTANGQRFHLAKTIPSNSFQNEDVTPAVMAAPTAPSSVAATVFSPSGITLRWNGSSGLTYHVYRRVTSNNSVILRLDDPPGSLANRGVADSVFADAVFFNGTDPSDSACPLKRGDFNCDGFTDSVDLTEMVEHVFFNGPPPCDPCLN